MMANVMQTAVGACVKEDWLTTSTKINPDSAEIPILDLDASLARPFAINRDQNKFESGIAQIGHDVHE